MFNIKSFTKALLVSSIFLSISSAYAMDDDQQKIPSLNLQMLKKGYESGRKGEFLEIDGQKYLVTTEFQDHIPTFPSHLKETDIIVGYRGKGNAFSFSYSQGTFEKKYNTSTHIWEDDPSKLQGCVRYFNLVVKRVFPEKQNIFNTPPILSSQENIKEQKEDLLSYENLIKHIQATSKHLENIQPKEGQLIVSYGNYSPLLKDLLPFISSGEVDFRGVGKDYKRIEWTPEDLSALATSSLTFANLLHCGPEELKVLFPATPLSNIPFWKDLKKLWIQNSDLGIEEATQLAKYIQETNIEEINLWGSFSKSGAATAFVKNLKSKSLHTLQLGYNNLTLKELKEIAENLPENVLTLGLQYNFFEDEGAIAFVKNLKSKTLGSIDFHKNNIRSGVGVLKNLPANIHAINLNENLIKDEVVVELSQSVPQTLKTLKLENNFLSDEGIVNFVQNLKALHTLGITSKDNLYALQDLNEKNRIQLIKNLKKTPLDTFILNHKSEKVSSLILPKEEVRKYDSFKVVIEPDIIKNAAKENFSVKYDANKGVWIGREFLTAENVAWWYQRLGYEAYMQYGQYIKAQAKANMEKSSENIRSSSAMTSNSSTSYSNNKTFEEAMASVFGAPTKRQPTFQEEVDGFFSLRGNTTPDSQYQTIFEKQPSKPSDGDYLGAWRGFKYNLDHCKQVPTWVIYASSEPVEDLLYKKVSVTSPQIKMAKTSAISASFSIDLGIYNSPIAQAFDKEKGNTAFKQLSIPLLHTTADFMEEINPNSKAIIIRPLTSLSGILKKSNIKFSESKGYPQDIDYPYIRCTRSFSGRLYDIEDTLTTEEKEKFGHSPFILIDPRTSTLYQISENHWFARNPFLGGTDRKNIQAFPFFTMAIEDVKTPQ